MLQKRNHRFKDLTGKRFGRLVALSFLGSIIKVPGATRKSVWQCQCDCGTSTDVYAQNLVKMHTTSCGCLLNEVRSISHTKHGMRNTPEYRTWCGMISRCTNPKNNRWNIYGGMGISVCAEWRESFEVFFNHIGPKPTPDHSIDRYPNKDGNYEPGNVRWATRSEQMNNRRHFLIPKNRKEHCPQGHAYSGENIYIHKGAHICLTCKRANARKWKQTHTPL